MPTSRTIPGLLDEMSSKYPDRNFLIDDDRRTSYREFRENARALAKQFHSLGVRKDDKVALLMSNRIEWLEVYFAVTMLGAVLVAVNTWWRRTEIHHALSLTDTTVLVMSDCFGNSDYTYEVTAIGDLPNQLPQLKHIICLGSNMPAGALAYEKWRDANDGTMSEAELDVTINEVTSSDVALILFTSGSTGKSKAAMLAHGGLVENPHGVGERMHVTEKDRLLLVLSLFWSASCCNALFNLMTHGGSIVLAPRFDPELTLKKIQDERCTVMYTQPNIVHAIYNYPDRKRYDISSLRTGMCRPEVIDLLVEMGATEFSTTYGLTEGYGNSCASDGRAPLDTRRTSSGFPLANTMLEIVDPATRRPLPPGSLGEVRVKGYVTSGYYKDPERTREAIDDEGWLYTGDLAVLDEGGFRFKCRLKELIKTGGINVTPSEVEELLLLFPGVLQAVVVGLPDAVREEIVAAIVVPRSGHHFTAGNLVSHCKELAAAYKVPRFIYITDSASVPLTDTGKVSKRHVQAMLAEMYLAGQVA